MSYIHLHKKHPRRPVDWRWELAKYIRQQDQQNYIGADAYVKSAIEFQVSLEQCKNDYDKFLFFDRYADKYLAYDVQNSCAALTLQGHRKQGKNSSVKSMLEAYALANLSCEEISSRVSLTPRAVDWYERWFFNVRDRLKSFGWIMEEVIGDCVYGGMTTDDLDVIWKLYGYFGGAKILDAAIATFPVTSFHGNDDDWDEFLKDDCNTNLTYKAAIASRGVEVHERSIRSILEMYARLRETTELANQGKSNKDLLVKSMDSLMKNIGWSVGMGENSLEYHAFSQYDLSNVEPRADELLAVSVSGKPLPQIEDFNAEFPEPVNGPTEVKQTN